MRFERDIFPMLYMPLLGVAIVGQMYILIPAVDILSRNLMISSTQAQLLTTLFSLCYAGGVIFWGSLSDSMGRKRVMLLGLFGLILTTAALAGVTDYSKLAILRALQGLFASAFPPVIIAWMSQNLAEHNRATGISWLTCSFLMSSLLGQLYGEWLIMQNLMLAMSIMAVFYFLSLLVLARLPENRAETPALPLSTVLKSLFNVLNHPQLRPFYAIAPLCLGSLVSVYVFLSFSDLSVSTLRLIALPAMLMPLFAYRIAHRFGTERTLSISALCAALSLLAQFWVLPGLAVTHFLFVAAISTLIPLIVIALSQRSPPELRGAALSVYTFILFLGASAGSLLGRYPVSLPVLAVLLLLASAWLYRQRR